MTEQQDVAASNDAVWITDAPSLRAWLEPVGSGDVLGLDTEFTRRDTFYSQLALLQLAHGTRRALVDPLSFDMAGLLRDKLGCTDIVCIMHSAGEDLETLAPWLPEGPGCLFDTQIAAAFAGLGYGLGYRALVSQLCGVDLDKGETRSDWTRRPLSDAQQRYAVLDVEYLEPLHAQLLDQVQKSGHLDWFEQECAQLKQRAHVDEWDHQAQRSLPAAAEWSRVGQARLRRILEWREQAARHWDKPRTWLLDNAHALELANHSPADADALAQATRGLRAMRGEQRAQLLELLKTEPDADEVIATRPIPGRLTGSAKEAVAAMKRQVEALAAELNLPPGLLCARKHLESLVFERSWPEALHGWRQPLLQPRLMPLLPEA